DPGQRLEQRALAGAVRSDDCEAVAVLDAEGHVPECPEVGRPIGPAAEVLERVAERRLAREPEAVLDAQPVDVDRVRGGGRLFAHHSTFANDGSSRLKKTTAIPRRTVDAARTKTSGPQSGA